MISRLFRGLQQYERNVMNLVDNSFDLEYHLTSDSFPPKAYPIDLCSDSLKLKNSDILSPSMDCISQSMLMTLRRRED